MCTCCLYNGAAARTTVLEPLLNTNSLASFVGLLQPSTSTLSVVAPPAGEPATSCFWESRSIFNFDVWHYLVSLCFSTPYSSNSSHTIPTGLLKCQHFCIGYLFFFEVVLPIIVSVLGSLLIVKNRLQVEGLTKIEGRY